MSNKSKSFRATFEDVLVSQEKLRRWLDRLVIESRPLKPEERGPFMQLVGRAMLGQGSKIPVLKDYGKPLGMTWQSENLEESVESETAEDYIRFLAYWEGDKLVTKSGEEESISTAWKEARQLALKVFSLALNTAASISAERVPYEPTQAERF